VAVDRHGRLRDIAPPVQPVFTTAGGTMRVCKFLAQEVLRKLQGDVHEGAREQVENVGLGLVLRHAQVPLTLDVESRQEVVHRLRSGQRAMGGNTPKHRRLYMMIFLGDLRSCFGMRSRYRCSGRRNACGAGYPS